MKKFALALLVLLSGCVIPVVDEGIDLAEPINLDRPEPKPSTPSTSEVAPKQEPQEPVKAPTPRKMSYRWAPPAGERMSDHLRKTHGVDVAGMSASKIQEVHDDIHNNVVADTPKQNIIIQYSTSWCGYCKSDIQNIIPKWKAKGWVFATPVDETANPKGVYPRYEIRFADGTVKHHSGSLSTWKN